MAQHACTRCGCVVAGILLDAHDRWHAEEPERVARAQQEMAMRRRFPMRRGGRR